MPNTALTTGITEADRLVPRRIFRPELLCLRADERRYG